MNDRLIKSLDSLRSLFSAETTPKRTAHVEVLSVAMLLLSMKHTII